jgi:hypothetical protein
VLEIELNRKEKRFQKETEARQQDQTTKRAVDAQQDAPVDQPLTAEALVSKPGVVDETPQGQAEPEPSKPKPFRIPKSIFENPPPTLETSTFARPLTPPPAYTTTVQPEPPAVIVPATVPDSVNTQPETEPIPDTTLSSIEEPERAAQPSSVTAPPQSRYAPPSIPPSNRSRSPPSSRSNPGSEKRTTPKLNRNSGSRALAQAQMFEAMASGQKPESSRRVSRANSNASGSEYSRDSQDINEEVITGLDIVPATSPTPAPLAPLSYKSRPPLKRAGTSTSATSTPSTSTAPREPIQRPKTPPRQRALTNPTDPAIFGQGPQPRPGSREPVRRTSKSGTTPTARIPISRSSSQAATQASRGALERRGTGTERTGSPRAPARTATAQASSPRATSQANRGAARSSLASTMTTGRGNRAMTTRVGGPAERGRLGRPETLSPAQGRAVAGRKTTSALFRDIDALVNQDVGGKRPGA